MFLEFCLPVSDTRAAYLISHTTIRTHFLKIWAINCTDPQKGQKLVKNSEMIVKIHQESEKIETENREEELEYDTVY